jgi:hypothetical protein
MMMMMSSRQQCLQQAVRRQAEQAAPVSVMIMAGMKGSHVFGTNS